MTAENVDTLFWAALGLCAFAMICFATFGYMSMRKQPGAEDPKSGAGAARPEGADSLSGVLEALSKVTTAFGTSGPISTAATLAIFFMIVALITSGLITIGTPSGG